MSFIPKRFGLRTMLLAMVAITVSGVLIRDYVQRRAATRQLRYTLAGYEAGRVPWTDVIAASRDMANAEARSLWISERTARLAHIVRMYRMMRDLHSGACELNPDEIDRRYNYLTEEVDRYERRLEDE